MFDKRHFNALDRGGIPTLVLEGPGGRRYPKGTYCPLKEMALSGSLDGPLASLVLRQVFRGPDPEKTVEAIYRFPLPGDAAVKSVTVAFGTVRIETALARREAARRDYREAVKRGRQAALLEEEDSGIFILRIAGLKGGEDVTVETGFLLWLRPRRGACELRVPLTLAPRYTRADEGMEALRRQPLGVAWDPGYRFSLELECRGLGAPEGVTHPLETEFLGEGYRACLQEQGAFPDQDCVIRFPLEGAEGVSLMSFGWREGDRTWFSALVQGPATDVSETVPREVILLVDRSGSMGGPKWEATAWAVRSLLSGLGKDELFNVGYFDSVVEWFRPRGLASAANDVSEALAVLEGIGPCGGTELGVALEQALRMSRTRGNFARHVVILTDGQVTDSERIFALAEGESRKKNRRRISVVCIDSAPNEPLAVGLAEKGGGEAVFLTSDPEESDITTALEEVLEGMARPLLQGLALCAKDGRVRDAAGVKRTVSVGGREGIDLGDLPAGRPVWVAGWVEGSDKAGLVLAGSDGKPIAESDPGGNPAESVKGLCGALRIARLERLLESRVPEPEIAGALASMGLEPEDRDRPLYPENRDTDLSETIREALAAESLAAGIVSTETAFVAIRSEAGRKVSETLAVPAMRPRGWSGEFDTMACIPDPGALRSMSKMPIDFDSSPAPCLSMDFPSYKARSDTDFGSLRSMPELGFAPPPSPVVFSFSGKPVFDDNGVAVLVDGKKEAGESGSAVLKRLAVSIAAPLAAELAPVAEKILLRLFVGDLVAPRVEVSLKALLDAGGSRPLNIRVVPGEALECRLFAPDIAGLRDKLELSVEIRTA